MNSPDAPRTETDQTPGDPMTAAPHITDPNHTSNLYRIDAHTTDRLAGLAERRTREARFYRTQADQNQHLAAHQILLAALESQPTERTTGIDQVLFDENGEPDMQRVCAFLRLVIQGVPAQQALQRLLDDHDSSVIEAARLVVKRMHNAADSARPGPHSQSGFAPIQPSQPPMFPPAPPEAPAERSLEMRRVDPNVPAPATAPMPAVPPRQEVLKPPLPSRLAPDATQQMPPVTDDEEAEPGLPFSGAASTAASPRRRSASALKAKAHDAAGSGDGDDSES
jgi:hypothetical protein